MQHQRKLEQLFGNRPAFTRLPGIGLDMDDAVETVQEDSMTSADPPGMQRQQRLDKYTQQIKISHLQLLHIEVLTHKSDGMEQTSLVFLESIKLDYGFRAPQLQWLCGAHNFTSVLKEKKN